jgi:branched-chain amino acid transport system ATP-binding protein
LGALGTSCYLPCAQVGRSVGPVVEAPEGSAGLDTRADGDAPLLEARDITIGFGGVLALDEVSMSVGTGEVVGVIGPNGAGKTTLFNVICGFVHPNSGHVVYRGHTLHRHHPHDLAKLGVARTLQGVGLCAGLTVLENVMLGAQPVLRSDPASSFLGLWRSSREERQTAARAMEVLDDLGVAAYAHRLPSALPYAVQKQTALARALMAEPSVLLLDEPASGLSEAEMTSLGSRIRSLTARMSVLLVEHHMDLVMSVCDRIVVLNFGRVIAHGTPEAIRADPEVATAYLGEAVDATTAPVEAGEHDA